MIVKYKIINNVIRIFVPFSKANKILHLIIDTGAQMSIVKFGAIRQNTLMCTEDRRPVKGISSGSCTSTMGRIMGNLTFNDVPFFHGFQVMKNADLDIPADGLLGNDFLVNYGAILKLDESTMELRFPKYYMNEIDQTISMFTRGDVRPKEATHTQEEMKLNQKEIEQENLLQSGIFLFASKSQKLQENLDNDKIELISSEELSDEYFVQDNGKQPNGEKINEKTTSISKKCKNRDFYKDLNMESLKYVETINLKAIDNEINIEQCIITDKKEEIFNMNAIINENAEITNANERAKYLMKNLDLQHCETIQREAMNKLCKKYNKAFFIEGDKFEHTDVIEHHIQLKPGTQPIFTRQYRIPESQKEEVQRQIDEMETKGIIEKSNSPWNSPLLLVPKKPDENGDKRFRLVIDYRKLNSVTMPHAYPIPLIDEIIDQMGNSTIFTTLDLQGAFHQIPMEATSKEYTAFSSSFGHYAFRSSPFGLLGSPFTWLRCIHTVLASLIGHNVFVYMDDILIHSRDLDEHIDLLRKVFDCLINHKLKLNVAKSKFFAREVSYLGHIISGNGMKADPKKIECMVKFPRPETLTEVQRFLGMCNYYRRYVQDFAKLAKPLHNLCRKDIPFIWSENCEIAFNKLKKLLTTSPVLIFPNFCDTFIITTDASDYAVGAVISQGNIPYDKPIHYFSKTLGNAQIRYSTIEKELLAIVWAIENFRHYLYGREFLILTDHKPLTYLFSAKNINNRLHRWKLNLMEYNFKIVHKNGAQNVVADALSRIKMKDEKIDSNALMAQSIEEIMEKTNIFPVQTRSSTRQIVNDTNMDDKTPNTDEILPYIEEKSDFITNVGEYDHIFFIFSSSTCELKRKMEHKLKIKINMPDTHENLYELDGDRTIVKIYPYAPVINWQEENEIKSILTTLVNFCENRKLENIAINIDFNNFMKYHEFKYLMQSVSKNKSIKITFYLSKVIEITDVSDINKILETYHKSLLGGHTGLERMKNTIRRYYNWHGITKDIREYIRKCATCEKTKISTHTKMPLQISTTATKPFEKIFMDIVGPINPISSENYRYIFTANCDLSKYAIAVPLEDCTAIETARALIHGLILRFGIPKIIVSDNGSNFIAETMKEVTKILKIKKLLTTPYHPQSNQVERFHRSLSTYLKAYVQNEDADWAKYLDFAIFTYNNTYNSTTGFAPNELVFGNAFEIPCEITARKIPIYNYDNYAHELRHKLKAMHDLARENIIKRKVENKNYYDGKAKTTGLNLKPNDLVLILKNKKEFKFEQPYDGPYRVEKILSPVTVLIRKGRKSIKIHMDRVKLAKADYGPKTPPPI